LTEQQEKYRLHINNDNVSDRIFTTGQNANKTQMWVTTMLPLSCQWGKLMLQNMISGTSGRWMSIWIVAANL